MSAGARLRAPVFRGSGSAFAQRAKTTGTTAILALAAVYVLVWCVGRFDLRKTLHVAVLGAGILIMSLMLAHAFGRFYGGL